MATSRGSLYLIETGDLFGSQRANSNGSFGTQLLTRRFAPKYHHQTSACGTLRATFYSSDLSRVEETRELNSPFRFTYADELSHVWNVDRILATARRPAGGRSALQVGRGVIDPLAALTAVPAVLTPDASQAATAPLDGTTAHPGPSPSDGPLLLLGAAAAAAVTACCAAAVNRLRRRSLD